MRQLLRLVSGQRRHPLPVHADCRIPFKLKYLSGSTGNHGGQQTSGFLLQPVRFLFPGRAVFFILNAHFSNASGHR